MTSKAPAAAASRIKLLALMEPATVTGAAKNMLDFCRTARDLKRQHPDSVAVETSIVTYDRRRESPSGSTQASKSAEAGTNAVAPPNEFVAAGRELGLEVDVIHERFRFDLRVIPSLRLIVERRAPDIILTHHVKSHFLLKWSGLWREFPWVAFHHGYTKTLRRERIYNQMDRLSLPTAHRVITVCEAFAQELVRAGVARERISVQHNSISKREPAHPAEVQALKQQLRLADDEYLVLAVGRLSSEKAHLDLILAFQHLRAAAPDIKARLLIIGDGPERGKLETAAASLGLSQHVNFAGQLSDVNSYYAAADVLALPSHSEGSPYVLLEAMAAGLPVVATAVGGVPEMVKNEESALLVSPRDSQAMAAALKRILTDRELAHKLSSQASLLVATRFSPETYFHSLVEIYRAILSGADRPGLQTV